MKFLGCQTEESLARPMWFLFFFKVFFCLYFACFCMIWTVFLFILASFNTGYNCFLFPRSILETVFGFYNRFLPVFKIALELFFGSCMMRIY